jgi:cyd operon protein YbgT
MHQFIRGEKQMWYFAWILGLPLAAGFAVMNAMWYELMDDRAKEGQNKGA